MDRVINDRGDCGDNANFGSTDRARKKDLDKEKEKGEEGRDDGKRESKHPLITIHGCLCLKECRTNFEIFMVAAADRGTIRRFFIISRKKFALPTTRYFIGAGLSNAICKICT